MANEIAQESSAIVLDEKPDNDEAKVSDKKETAIEEIEGKLNENGHTGGEPKEENVKNDEKKEEEEKPAEDEKKKEEDDDDKKEEDDDDDESSEEELGLLEKPVEILTKKRDRKSTDRFAAKVLEEDKGDKIDFTQGKGTRLGDIEFVRKSIDKTGSDDLKVLHRVMYHKPGKNTVIKRNIRNFCGFPFEKDSSYCLSSISTIERLTVSGLRFILGILGVEKGLEKVKMQQALMDFLMKPIDTGKVHPSGKKTPTTKKTKKKTRKSTGSATKGRKKRDDDADKVSSASSDSEDEEEREKPKSAKKKPSSEKKEKSKPKKHTPVKIAIPSKGKKSRTPSKRKAELSDSNDEDDEPLAKKTKSAPTNAELKKTVSVILKDADLEEVTMKTVVRQVYDKYPAFDLTSKKDFIKGVVKELIS